MVKPDFKQFKESAARQFQGMATGPLFVANIDRDVLWETYLKSFPEGSNPIFKTRTEYDCSCCRHFVKTLGGVVAVKEGALVTIWDNDIQYGPYRAVSDAMSSLVKSAAIRNIFLNKERSVGTATSRQLLPDSIVVSWNHFHVNLPISVVSDDIGTKHGEATATHDVMLRGLEAISLSVVDTVLELIGQNSLYRGEEHTFVLESYRKLKVSFDKLPGAQSKDLFVWSNIGQPQSVSRIRNTVIGSLLVDLAEGAELEIAVASFESKVAPANYKRPTAIVSKAMIQKAQETIAKLNLTTALERRYARIEDITVNNVLFADRTAKRSMNVFEELASRIPETRKSIDKVEEIGIEEFVSKVLPKAESIEVLIENRHSGNFVSLVAPCDPTAPLLFKWPNNFSWSYAGDVTDSIKERVKRAGGSITGDLCCRLAWDYTDDLDFHMMEPGGGHIYYSNKRMLSRCGGMLDVDANGGDGIMAHPVENIYYADHRKMTAGVYALKVHNYNRRSSGIGFEVEIEFGGATYNFAFDKALRTGEAVVVAKIQCNGLDFKIIESLPSAQSTKQIWGIATHVFHKVTVVMLSPNHWNDRTVGNKHYFFMVEGCTQEGKSRGFYNEFLDESLTPHRKVLEIVGAKMRTDESDRQLSGIGFSSTQRNSVLCRVNGSFTRTVRVTF